MQREVGIDLDILEKRSPQGDQEAFKEWMGMHIRKIEQFALQNGLARKSAGTVAETVFRDLYVSLGELDERELAEEELYRRTLNVLDRLQTETFHEDLFSFQEDNDLHSRVCALPKEYRVPFILDRFHNKSSKEIAEITGRTVHQAEQAVNEALSVLDESDLDKKLEFLSKSYERLSPTCDEANIFHSKKEEPLPVEQKSEIEKGRKPFLFWGMGVGVLLVLLSMITYINGNAYEKKSAEKFMETAKVSFQQELERNLQLAGLPAPEYIRRDVYAETYGEDTRREFDWFIADLEEQLEKGGKIDRKKGNADFDTLIHKLMIPSEMVAELAGKTLVDDQEKSMEFVNEYIVKMITLLRSYMYIFEQNESLIRESGRNDEGGYDLEAFYAKKSTYPKAFQQALDGMEAQGIFLINDMNSDMPADYVYVRPDIGTPELSKALQENLHPDTGIYLAIFMGDLVDIHKRSVEEQTDLLFLLEKGLFQAEGYRELHSLISNAFVSVMYSITGMIGQLEIRDSVGIIKEDYKEAWTRIAFNGKDSPSAQMMREVVIEMEESGWTTSDYLDRLQYFFIEGELKRIMGEMKK
ncbi:sigma factor-like helix-turn-helix DNA-binding protein [Sporosarcina koreensis]|uniref:Sigma factor-like helix-turn-helix DNA-binding protein n=1 Tax=Sporosarcina koreensis TaxID=334735 RepID=A0ABW0TT54_9BACL